MANIPSAQKRARQEKRRHLHNVDRRSMMRTTLKKTLQHLQSGDHEASAASYRQLVSVLDRMATKKLIHKNKAAHHKSRLNARLRALSPN